jgi:hypothetical protein
MVDRGNYLLYISIGLNHRRNGGRVPQKRQGLEQDSHRRLSPPRHYSRISTLDVPERGELKLIRNLDVSHKDHVEFIFSCITANLISKANKIQKHWRLK